MMKKKMFVCFLPMFLSEYWKKLETILRIFFSCRHFEETDEIMSRQKIFSSLFGVSQKTAAIKTICQVLYLIAYRLKEHSSSQTENQIQGKYRNCHHRILSCQHSQYHCRNLLPLPHIGLSLCSNLVLHLHQRIL